MLMYSGVFPSGDRGIKANAQFSCVTGDVRRKIGATRAFASKATSYYEYSRFVCHVFCVIVLLPVPSTVADGLKFKINLPTILARFFLYLVGVMCECNSVA